ncbi:MAG: hypothetical protein K6G38_06075 [Gammaproteobacteria bacterium]|nr:hypothetical protein [Gammaproteobacteria bacterium]
MKRKLLLAVFSLLCVLGLVACGQNTTTVEPVVTTTQETKYTVQFYNGDTVLKTLKVAKGGSVEESQIPTVSVDGYALKGWSLTDGGELVTVTEVKINDATKFYAVLEEVKVDDGLDVEALKEEGKSYYLVVGWWETTAINDDGSAKVTSGLTKTIVKHWYQNLLVYLKAFGATSEELANIQIRNYSSATVADMGTAVNADGDVDLMIGVGNNINSTAGVSLLDSSNDNKVGGIIMSSVEAGRYVALLTDNAPAVSVFDWIKNYDQGKSSFLMETNLTVSGITLAASRNVQVTYTVTVVADTEKVSTLKEATDVVDASNVVVPEGKEFVGFALAADGEATVLKAVDGVTLADIKDLFTNGATALSLYPVFRDVVVASEDLIVYIQVNGSNLTMPEANLLIDRFEFTLGQENDIKWVVVDGNAATFTEAINAQLASGYIDVIIGGNKPLNTFGADATRGLANCGTGYFANDSRKVMVSSSVKNTELAATLYDQLIVASTEYSLAVEFWRVGTWVTTEEETALKAGITSCVCTYLGVADEAALLSTYNLKVTYYESGAGITKVAPLSAEARTLKGGKPVDLIIGCGANAADEGNMVEITELKDISTTLVADGRKVAYVNENRLAKAVYDNYFVVAQAAS